MARDDLILDRYEPLGTAGEGGFGTVQVAWDPRIQRKVAVKTIRLTALDAARAYLPGAQAVSAEIDSEAGQDALPWADYQSEPFSDASQIAYSPESDSASAGTGASGQVTSLSHVPGLDEARTAAMLDDPRIVTVYDFEIRGREAYLIMEYVEGITLTSLLSDYSDFLTLDMVAAVFDSVAAALVTAHGAGVLHLDIKPDNILINTQGQVKVTDFGLATLADASGAGKTGGGTIGYMPPEQIRREKLDARSDEWSLAAVAYEMLTGSNPFRVQGLDAALQAIEEAELVLPSLCWRDIDEQIDDVVFYALDPDRSERYASVLDFAEEAEKFLGDSDKGTAQLELVVADALGLGDWSEPDDDAYADAGYGLSTAGMRAARTGGTGRSSSQGGGAQGFLKAVESRLGLGGASQAALAPAGRSRQELSPQRSFTERFLDLMVDQDETAEQDDRGESAGTGRSRAETALATPRVPIAERASERTVWLASHALGALGSGFIAALATSNMQPITSAFGPGAIYVIGILTIVAAVLGAIRSHIGALASLSLLGVAFVMCGHPIVGAFVLIVAVAWWYTIGHEGAASANVVLLLPLLGSIGGSTMVPFFSGASLPPLRACVTTLVAFVLAIILSGLGSASILDWGAFAHWDFVRPDVSGIIVRVLTRPDTWTIGLGWMVATAVLSVLRLSGSRALNIIGAACALVAVLVGTLVLCPPSPQLLVSAILACVVLLVYEL